MIDDLFIKTNLHRIFENNGIVYLEDIQDELHIDSIQFITSICDIEDFFNIEIPDEYLLIDKFNDLTFIVEIIKKLIN